MKKKLFIHLLANFLAASLCLKCFDGKNVWFSFNEKSWSYNRMNFYVPEVLNVHMNEIYKKLITIK